MAGERSEEFDRVWRPHAGARLAGWVLGGVAALLALAGLATAAGGGAGIGSAVLVALVNGLVAVCAWRWGSHPLIGASDAGLTVRNPLRSLVVPWDDIAGCAPSSLGVTIALRSGGQVVAWAVQKPTLSTWLGRPTRADEVVTYIATRAQAKPPDAPTPDADGP